MIISSGMTHESSKSLTIRVLIFNFSRHTVWRQCGWRVQFCPLLQAFVQEDRKRIASFVSFYFYSVLHLLLGLLYGLVKWITGTYSEPTIQSNKKMANKPLIYTSRDLNYLRLGWTTQRPSFTKEKKKRMTLNPLTMGMIIYADF